MLGLTEQIAPKTLGLEMEDLSNEVQDKLLTLGKRQRTLFDVEGELEKELEFQIYRAEMQKRRTILDPLRAAYKGLRDTRVNDNLKLAAGKIENNQSFQIIPNQKAALQVLSIVKGGLIQAGQKVDPEGPITVAMTPSDIIDVQPKAKTDDVAATNPATTETPEVTTVSPEDLLGNLSMGGDPLTAAINAAWEAQDAVLARTRYLAENSSGTEMPRYVKLKQRILLGQQEAALRAVDQAIVEAQKANDAAVRETLEGVRDEMGQSKALIEAKQFSLLTQQIQADTLETLDDLRRRFIPLQKAVSETAEENKRQGGVDAFNLKYLLRDQDLDQAVAILDDLNQFQLWERDVARKLDRFAKLPAKEAPGVVHRKRPTARGHLRPRDAAWRCWPTCSRSWPRFPARSPRRSRRRALRAGIVETCVERRRDRRRRQRRGGAKPAPRGRGIGRPGAAQSQGPAGRAGTGDRCRNQTRVRRARDDTGAVAKAADARSASRAAQGGQAVAGRCAGDHAAVAGERFPAQISRSAGGVLCVVRGGGEEGMNHPTETSRVRTPTNLILQCPHRARMRFTPVRATGGHPPWRHL